MDDFRYLAPATLKEASELLGEYGSRARILAGGTDLIVQLREGRRNAEAIIDVKHVPELMKVSLESTGLSVGAAVPCSRLYEDTAIVASYPGLTDAARIIGGWQIQSRASVGGNLCNSSPAADSIPALMALDATCQIASKSSTRTTSVTGFCTGPGKNVLPPGELLVSLTLPAQPSKTSSAYLRFIPRNEMDIAVVGAGAWVQLDSSGQKIVAARIALGAVAPTPVLADEAGRFLVGKDTSDKTLEQAGDLARKVASPIDDMRGTAEFRLHIAGVLTKRVLAVAIERARKSK